MSGNSAANTPNLLSSVLLLLDLLSGALSLLLQAVSGESIFRFELLGGLQVVVDQGEASGASTTEDGTEAEKVDEVGLTDLEQLYFSQANTQVKKIRILQTVL